MSEEIKSEEVEDKQYLKIACSKCGQKLNVTHLEPFSVIDCPSCSEEITVPKWFDNYLLEEISGEGGMATVYRTIDVALGREVAIKVLNDDISKDPKQAELFLHEARTAATINHYAVVPIFTCGECKGVPYIVMQYMNGGSLEYSLKKATIDGIQLPLDSVIAWMIDVAEGLDNAKRHGIVHHDIKPGNIMLDSDGKAKISDFGLAQINTDSSQNSADGNWFSPHYVSPEQAKEGTEGYSGDVYSLGATFYHLITGETPFKGKNNDDLEGIVRERFLKTPKSPIEIRPSIPKNISALIMLMISKDKFDRPSYRDIIKKLSKTSVKKKKGAAFVPKKQTKTEGNIPPARSRQRIKKKSSFLFKVATYGSVNIVGLSLLWFFGVLDPLLNKTGLMEEFPFLRRNDYVEQPEINDLNPKITSNFTKGNVQEATKLAQSAFSSSSSLKIKRQAGVQLIISKYLNKDANANEFATVVVDKMLEYGIKEVDPAISVLRYLSNTQISDQEIFDSLKDDKEYKQLSGFIITLRKLYNAESNENILPTLRLYHNSALLSKYSWVNAWKQRLPMWLKCIETGEGDSSFLPPVFKDKITEKIVSAPIKDIVKPIEKVVSTLAKGTVVEPISISQLNEKWLNDNRPFASERPSIYKVDSTGTQEQYIQKLFPEHIEGEKARFAQLANLKGLVKNLMTKYPYDGRDGIVTNDSKTLRGMAVFENDKLLINTPSGVEVLSFNDIPTSQMIKILSFYADLYEESLGEDIGIASVARRKAANIYFNIALLQDWTNDYNGCVDSVNKSVKLDASSVISDLRNCILR